MGKSESKQQDESLPGFLIDNRGQAIKLSGLQLNGVSAEAARGGDTVKVWTRLWLTSDDRLFHRIRALSEVAHLREFRPYDQRRTGEFEACCGAWCCRRKDLYACARVTGAAHPRSTGLLHLTAPPLVQPSES